MSKQKSLPDLAEISDRTGISRDLLSALKDCTIWGTKAACKDSDPELIFIENQKTATKEIWAMCSGCKVRPNCVVASCLNDEPYGFWAATTQKDRRGIVKSSSKLLSWVMWANDVRQGLLSSAHATRSG